MSFFYNPYIGNYIRNLIFLKIIRELKNNKIIIDNVLDIGCGNGAYCVLFNKYFPNASIMGIDINNRFMQNKNCNILFFESDILQFDPPNNFDFIYSIDVLDDIKKWESALYKAGQLLNEDGYLFLHIPIHPRPIYFLRNKKIKEYWENDLTISISHIEKNNLIMILKKMGLVIMHSSYTFNSATVFFQEIDLYLLHSKYRVVRLMRYIINPVVRLFIRSINIYSFTKCNSYYVLAKKN